MYFGGEIELHFLKKEMEFFHPLSLRKPCLY